MSLNIFQIWESIGKTTPFAVRRDNWEEKYYTIVEKVEIKKMPYGKAYGYTTINGEFSNHYEYAEEWVKDKTIPCSGCYQWTLVENPELLKPKKESKPVEIVSYQLYTKDSLLRFGKYKDKTITDIFIADHSYIEWAINKIKEFVLTSDTFDFFDNMYDNFRFGEATKKINAGKLKKIPENKLT
jgi:hypothetical protein